MSRKILIIASVLTLMVGCTPKLRPEATLPASVAQAAKIENVGVALVLGGGGSRGIAHIGAIEVLQENNIPIDLIVGASAGSAVGALYADSKDARKVKAVLYKLKAKEFMDFSLLNWSQMFIKPLTPFKGRAYEKFIKDNLNAKNFAELKIPFAVVTVDSETGEKFEINSGAIAPAVHASSAIPPLIGPVQLYGKHLFDGGIIEPVPIATAKGYNPKLIIAIDINAAPKKAMPKNIFDLLYKAFWISYHQLTMEQAKLADVYIQPDVQGHGIMEDDRKDELYQLGREAATAALPDIKKRLRKLGLTRG